MGETDAATRHRTTDSVRGVLGRGLVPAGYVVLDRHLRIVRPNRAFCRLVGFRSSELAGRLLETLVHPDDVAATVALAGALDRGELEAVHAFVRFVTRSGRARAFTMVARRDSGYRSDGCVVVLVPFETRDAENRLLPAGATRGSLADRAADLIYRYRLWPEPAFDYVSPVAEELTGYPPPAFYADPQLLLRMTDPADAARISELFAGHADEREVLVYRLHHRDGSVRWIEQRSTRLMDGGRRVLAVECIARDVTGRVRTDQSGSDVLLSMTRDVTNIAASAATEEEMLRRAIQRVCRQRGWPLGCGAVIGLEGAADDVTHVWWAADDLPHGDLASRFELTAWAPQGVGSTIVESESMVSTVDADAERHGFSRVVAYPLVAGTRVVGMLCFFVSDVESLGDDRFNLAMNDLGHYLGRELEHTSHELELRHEVSEGRAFLDRAAHQLRGPIGGVSLMAGALAEAAGEDGNELAPSLARLALQADHLQRLTVRLLEFSQIEQGRLVIEKGPFQVIDAVISAVHGSTIEHDVDVDIEPDLRAYGDEVLFVEMIVNLLDNAGRYGMPPYSVSATVGDGRVHVEVGDEGPGVPESVLAQQFEPLGRGLVGPESAGLGLAIVDRLARSMGGALRYQNRSSRGACFTVDLELCIDLDGGRPSPDDAPPAETGDPGVTTG